MSIDSLEVNDLVFVQDDLESEPLEGKVIQIDRARWFQPQVEIELSSGMIIWAWGEEVFPRQEEQKAHD